WRGGEGFPGGAGPPPPPRGHLFPLGPVGLLVPPPAAPGLRGGGPRARRRPPPRCAVGRARPPGGVAHARALRCATGGVRRSPGATGLAAAVGVSEGGGDARQTADLISRDDQVLAWYPGAEFDTLLPADNGTFTARAMGTSARPYPFQPVQGRLYHAANEAV